MTTQHIEGVEEFDELGSMPVPGIEEVQQESPDDTPRVPVHVEQGTVYRLPGRRAQCSTDLVSDTASVCVAYANDKRNRLTLISVDEPIYIARDRTSTGCLWPDGVPYTVEHCDAVWVKCATSSATTSVGATAELWAD